MPLIRQPQRGFPMVSFVFFFSPSVTNSIEKRKVERKLGYNSYA